ncbi:hypothetical protein KUCAC02_033875, partial [Chaenocephalus aceratus]
KFGMVLLKKTLQVEERYPYPVRLEAMYEAIDQAPREEEREAQTERIRAEMQSCRSGGSGGGGHAHR